jgi:peptide chain release factor 1
VPPRAARTPDTWSKSSSASIAVAPAGGVFDVEIVERLPALTVIRISGRGAETAFADEAGGHRWQRVPPGEKRGRVHTSTITIAVLAEPTEAQISIPAHELEWATCRGSGPGGQHRNTRESAVQLTHTPTGLRVRCESERSQHQNRAAALAVLRARLWDAERERRDGSRAEQRRLQVGSGMRGDKRRTIRCQEGVVTDHATGRSWRLREYERGDW